MVCRQAPAVDVALKNEAFEGRAFSDRLDRSRRYALQPRRRSRAKTNENKNTRNHDPGAVRRKKLADRRLGFSGHMISRRAMVSLLLEIGIYATQLSATATSRSRQSSAGILSLVTAQRLFAVTTRGG